MIEFPRVLPGEALPIYDYPDDEGMAEGFAKLPNSWAMVAIAMIPYAEVAARNVQQWLNKHYPEHAV